jgi:cyclic pyranopterin phosphate synthase
MTQLIDNFNRKVTYLRMSVTDRCDFRCVYCMTDKMQFLPRHEVLSLEELEFLGRAFVELGVSKIRITGGEPLVRNNILTLLQNLSKLSGLNELVITTNGSQLTKMAQSLRAAGVKRINISLDSLKAERFESMTRMAKFDQVLAGIDAAINAEFEAIKLNTVILKNRNDDEINDLVAFAIDKGIDISFIEEMPLGMISEHQRSDTFYSNQQILKKLEKSYILIPSIENTGGPSRYYNVINTNTRIGFISPHSHNFCDTCNRVRLTTEGRLLLCLGQEHSIDLKHIIRTNPNNMTVVKQAIINAMDLKPKGHEFDITKSSQIIRYMNMTGG